MINMELMQNNQSNDVTTTIPATHVTARTLPSAPKNTRSGWHPIKRIKNWIHDKKPLLIVTILILLLLILFFFKRIVITVGPGEVGVLYHRLTSGTQTDYVYPEKVHLIWPWDNLYIYNTRIQTIPHELTVLTNKGLPITLSLAIRCRPEYEMVGVLHKNVGPDYINLIVIPKIESILRKRIGQLNPDDVYTNKEGILTNILSIAIDEVMQDYIIVEDIIIRSMNMPPAIMEAIENKLVEEQLLAKYEFSLQVAQKEAERKRLEANGIKDYQTIVKSSLNDQFIRWQGVQATQEIAKSNNAKVVVIGSGKDGIPVILGNQ
ncbi:Prohibitin family protein [Gammaproteobacteria bacterium]